MIRVLPAVLLLCLLLPQPPVFAASPTVRVAVTSSFQPTLEILESRLEHATGVSIETTSASTGALYRQIAEGAPFDLFLAADGRHPLRLVRDQLAEDESLRPYARGQLILAGGPPGRPPKTTAVLIPRQRIAIPNPITAPYGQAAQDWLRQMRFWDEVRPRLVTANNVAQAVQWVESANVELAFSALPLARHLRKTAYSILPHQDYPAILHVGVVLSSGDNPAGARRLFAELLGPTMQAELGELGFLPLSGADPQE